MTTFRHSIKVPTQYRRMAVILKTALENKSSLKSLMYKEKHVRIRGMQAVLKQYIDNRAAIDTAIEKSKILIENPRLCPALCKILVTELLIGRKQLNGYSKPVETVRSYRDRLLEALGNSNIDYPIERKDRKPRYIRVNINLISVQDAHAMLAMEGWQKKNQNLFGNYDDFLKEVGKLEKHEYMTDMHVDDLLIFNSKQSYYWACHRYVKEKKFILQDKGTALVIELLRPSVGSTVLDMCAAPGIKTIHITNYMRNQGTVYAIEQNAERYITLKNMIQEAGCNIVQTVQHDALTISTNQCPEVEFILVDPSCTGSGMQNRMSIELDSTDQQHRLNKLANLQIKLLSHAMTAFPDVKRIAYSTCSIHPEENEEVVRQCMKFHASFKLLNVKKMLQRKWNNTGNSAYIGIGKNCIYCRPEIDLTDGIFIAIIEKCK